MAAVGADALLSLFPPGSATDPDGMLTIAGCRADALADEFGTPVLVASETALRARAREYVDALVDRWPNSRVVFASKAFPCTAIQRVMVEEGLGLDVAGGGEIVTALKAGADPARLVLHGNAKGDDEIAMVVEHGIGLVVVDNADDVDRLEAAVPDGGQQDVLVRVIPGVEADTHAHVLTGHAGSKFGLAPAAAAELIRRIERSPKLGMQGLHVHVGSPDGIAHRLRALLHVLADHQLFLHTRLLGDHRLLTPLLHLNRALLEGVTAQRALAVLARDRPPLHRHGLLP